MFFHRKANKLFHLQKKLNIISINIQAHLQTITIIKKVKSNSKTLHLSNKQFLIFPHTKGFLIKQKIFVLSKTNEKTKGEENKDFLKKTKRL